MSGTCICNRVERERESERERERYIYIHINTCINTYIHTYIYIHMYMYTYIYIHIHICINNLAFRHTGKCIFPSYIFMTYLCICTYMQNYVHICIRVGIQWPWGSYCPDFPTQLRLKQCRCKDQLSPSRGRYRVGISQNTAWYIAGKVGLALICLGLQVGMRKA